MRRSFARTPLACNTCRGRKTKCDGFRPKCGYCASKNAQCVWPAPLPGENYQEPSNQQYPLPSPSSGLLREYQTDAVTIEASQTPISPATVTEDQTQRGLDLCLGLFFERHFATDFCSFAYRPEFEVECKRNEVLGSTVIALCGRYLDDNDALGLFGLPTARHVCRHYTLKARSLCKEKSDQPSVTNIQANLILATAEILSVSGARHWLFTGSAIRMAEIMRLNKDFHQNHSLRHQEVRRRTYWACLLLDRLLAYLLGKHRTIDIDTISVPLPDADTALVFQEESRGVTLTNLAEQRRPSDLGLAPYLIKTVCLWSELADFAVYSRRRLDPYPPTDARSSLHIRHGALKAWQLSLAPSLRWNMENYRNHKALSQQRGFVACHVLLQSASCVAHQSYLPHLATYTRLVNLVDAAGWSYLHRDEHLISVCVSAALALGAMVSALVEQGEQASLQSIWAVPSFLATANTLLWIQYAQDPRLLSAETRARGKEYFALIRDLMMSWSSTWRAARQWLSSLCVMHDLYKAAYLGEISNQLLDIAADSANHEEDDADAGDEGGDFHPQPGDGYPSVVSLPNLQASVKFATGDTSVKSISVQSIWLQLSGGWPLGFPDVDALSSSLGDNAFSEAMGSL